MRLIHKDPEFIIKTAVYILLSESRKRLQLWHFIEETEQVGIIFAESGTHDKLLHCYQQIYNNEGNFCMKLHLGRGAGLLLYVVFSLLFQSKLFN